MDVDMRHKDAYSPCFIPEAHSHTCSPDLLVHRLKLAILRILTHSHHTCHWPGDHVYSSLRLTQPLYRHSLVNVKGFHSSMKPYRLGTFSLTMSSGPPVSGSVVATLLSKRCVSSTNTLSCPSVTDLSFFFFSVCWS